MCQDRTCLSDSWNWIARLQRREYSARGAKNTTMTMEMLFSTTYLQINVSSITDQGCNQIISYRITLSCTLECMMADKWSAFSFCAESIDSKSDCGRSFWWSGDISKWTNCSGTHIKSLTTFSGSQVSKIRKRYLQLGISWKLQRLWGYS